MNLVRPDDNTDAPPGNTVTLTACHSSKVVNVVTFDEDTGRSKRLYIPTTHGHCRAADILNSAVPKGAVSACQRNSVCANVSDTYFVESNKYQGQVVQETPESYGNKHILNSARSGNRLKGGGTAVHDVDVAHVGSRQPVATRKLES